MTRQFIASRQKVHNRGKAPVTFLNELVDWGIQAPTDIFSKNNAFDLYSSVVQQLGPWNGDRHRRAAMLEVLRVLGGFESSWNWSSGVDTANPTSNTPCTEEAGMFQCSGNSMSFDSSLKALLLASGGDGSCKSFISVTKSNHRFAIEYCARLLRFTTKHHGPVKGGRINEWLRRDSVDEILSFLP